MGRHLVLRPTKRDEVVSAGRLLGIGENTVNLRSATGVVVAGLVMAGAFEAHAQTTQSRSRDGASLVAPTLAPRATRPAPPPKLRLGVGDAVRLVTLHNIDLRMSFYNHLVERTRISEAEARFEPSAFVNASGGVNEVAFPQIFPTGNFNADGSPEFSRPSSPTVPMS